LPSITTLLNVLGQGKERRPGRSLAQGPDEGFRPFSAVRELIAHCHRHVATTANEPAAFAQQHSVEVGTVLDDRLGRVSQTKLDRPEATAFQGR
jgi:hypothetical protein